MPQVDWINVVLSVVTTALGVLFGLLGNGYVVWRRERRAYRALLTGIAGEARNNNAVLYESFLKYYKSGVVVRGFSTATVGRCLGDPQFVKHAQSADMDIIYEYLRNVCLANSYRAMAERLQLGHDKKAVEMWQEGLIETWAGNLAQCETSINRVIALTENAGDADRTGHEGAGADTTKTARR